MVSIYLFYDYFCIVELLLATMSTKINHVYEHSAVIENIWTRNKLMRNHVPIEWVFFLHE